MVYRLGEWESGRETGCDEVTERGQQRARRVEAGCNTWRGATPNMLLRLAAVGRSGACAREQWACPSFPWWPTPAEQQQGCVRGGVFGQQRQLPRTGGGRERGSIQRVQKAGRIAWGVAQMDGPGYDPCQAERGQRNRSETCACRRTFAMTLRRGARREEVIEEEPSRAG